MDCSAAYSFSVFGGIRARMFSIARLLIAADFWASANCWRKLFACTRNSKVGVPCARKLVVWLNSAIPTTAARNGCCMMSCMNCAGELNL